MRHQAVHIDAVGARHYHQTGRVLVIRLVAQVGHHGQLLGGHLPGDLLEDLGARGLVRQGCDDDLAVFQRPDGALLDRALAGLVDFADLIAGRDDLGVGRVVRSLDVGHQGIEPGLGVIEQLGAGVSHLAGVMGRNVGRHPHRDAGHPVEQYVGQARGQHLGLFHGAVEVGDPVGCALAELGEQNFREARQARLGVTHGGERLGVVRRPPVALAVHQGVAVGEGLGHQHHGFIAGAVPVGVVLTQHVTHGTGRFLVLGEGRESQLAHGVDDAALYRLETVADVRQGAVHDDVHGVVEVGLLGEGVQWLTLHPVEALL